MTNEELVKHHADARAFAENSDYDLAIKGAIKVSEDCASELLRRLNDADALRKENEELRKDRKRIDFLDLGNFGIRPRNVAGVLIGGRFNCIDYRGCHTLREAIDAVRQKSEWAHD